MMRMRWSMAASLIALTTVATLFVRPHPLLLWKASAMVPTGLYEIRSAS
jgi:type IV secretory pathway protease TraF